MANKKITELTALSAASLSKDDVIPIVSTSGTPITKKISVGTLLSTQASAGAPVYSNIVYSTTTSVPSVSLVKATLTSNVNAGATAVTAGEFNVAAGNASANTTYLYGLRVSTAMVAGANVFTEHAVAKLTLDVGNVASLITNTYGLVISHANTGTRAAAPRAFLCLTESVQTNSLSTQYLFELSQNGAGNVSSAVFADAVSTTIAKKLKVRINGTDYFIALTTAV